MKYALLMLILLTTGCTLHPLLGTRVHRFEHKGDQYVHCAILMTPAQPQMAEDAIKECEDAIRAGPKK